MTSSIRVLDLFCGTGGFSKGFEEIGTFEVVYGIDLLPHAVATFAANHPSAIADASDIRSIDVERVSQRLSLGRGDIEVVIGGPPCQGFSSIRPHRGSIREDSRNVLFRDFCKFVDYFRPVVFVFENVVGLATHNEGRSLEAIQDAFKDLGYETDWRILNAANYGVPQKRERLIMIGVENGLIPTFPEPTHSGAWPTIGYREPARMLRPAQPTLFSQTERLLPAITVADAIDDLPRIKSGEEATEYDKSPRTPYQRARRKKNRSLELHSSTRHTERMLEIIRHSGPNISSIPSHLVTSGFSSCYSRLSADEPSVTITVNFVHPASNRCIHPTLDRALTPREGARLQSFDDDFAFKGNRSQIVKQIGNAVPPLLGRAIASCLAKQVFCRATSVPAGK